MTSVTYSSTRGGQKNLDFRTVVMQGLAHDKGLFVPDTIPSVTPAELEEWRSLPFADLAVNVISKFVQDDQVPLAELTDIIKRSCAAFRSHEVTPLVNVGGHAILVRTLFFYFL
jgi:threonine synthase